MFLKHSRTYFRLKDKQDEYCLETRFIPGCGILYNIIAQPRSLANVYPLMSGADSERVREEVLGVGGPGDGVEG